MDSGSSNLGKEKKWGNKRKTTPVLFRKALYGILYILLTGCQWNPYITSSEIAFMRYS